VFSCKYRSLHELRSQKVNLFQFSHFSTFTSTSYHGSSITQVILKFTQTEIGGTKGTVNDQSETVSK